MPVLQQNEVEVSQQDKPFDARRDRTRVIFDESRPVWIPGTRFTFHVPYTGNNELFYFRASTFTVNPPRAAVTPNELQFSYDATDTSDKASMRADFERELSKVREHLEWLRRDFQPFSDDLRERAS